VATPSLIQMAGWMGSGKSTIAAALGREMTLVVLDHDTTKTALLAAGVPHPPAGAASYEVLFHVAEDLIRQGHSVLIDSPSLYASIPERGAAIARQTGARYYFIECDCTEDVAAARLAGRERRASQVTSITEAAAIRRDPTRHPHRPEHGWLAIETSLSIEHNLEQIRLYLDGAGCLG
jgi:predicted kinase